MIFSKERYGNAEELQEYVSVSKALSFETVQAPLRTAFETYIEPLLGASMSKRLIDIYNGSESGDKQTKLLKTAQMANANLALWGSFMELQFLVSDGGMHRDESDRLHSLYKYQEQELKESWKERGFNALDTMLDYLEDEIEEFAEYKESAFYKIQRSKIVRTTGEVNEYYFINNSRIVLMRLIPHIRVVSDTMIAPRMAQIYKELMVELNKDEVADKWEELRKSIVPVVVLHSIARLIRSTGSVTDRGLYFVSTEGSADSTSVKPADIESREVQARQAEADAESYWLLAEELLKNEFDFKKQPTSYVGFSKRNNDGKKSYWL